MHLRKADLTGDPRALLGFLARSPQPKAQHPGGKQIQQNTSPLGTSADKHDRSVQCVPYKAWLLAPGGRLG